MIVTIRCGIKRIMVVAVAIMALSGTATAQTGCYFQVITSFFSKEGTGYEKFSQLMEIGDDSTIAQLLEYVIDHHEEYESLSTIDPYDGLSRYRLLSLACFFLGRLHVDQLKLEAISFNENGTKKNVAFSSDKSVSSLPFYYSGTYQETRAMVEIDMTLNPFQFFNREEVALLYRLLNDEYVDVRGRDKYDEALEKLQAERDKLSYFTSDQRDVFQQKLDEAQEKLSTQSDE